MRIQEIQRMPKYRSDDDPSQHTEYYKVQGLKPVPQNSQYAYSDRVLQGQELLNLTQTDIAYSFYHVKDGLAKFIGMLNFRRISARGLRNPIQVSNVWLDPEFRNWGVGMMMYGVVLGLGYTIVGDDSQTPNARKLWVRLSQQPGVTVRGMIDVLTSSVDDPRDWDDEGKKLLAKLKKMGAQRMTDPNRVRQRYGDDWERFSFPVQPNKSGTELTAAGIPIYQSDTRWDDFDPVGLYATVAS